MKYSLEDLLTAIANFKPGDVPYKELRLGRPWRDLIQSGEFLRGFRVRVVDSLDDEQPYAVAGEAYGYIETPIPMDYAVSRQLLELCRGGDLWVQAPYHRCAGSRDTAQICFADNESAQLLYKLIGRMSQRNRYPLLENVDILSQGSSYYVTWNDSKPNQGFVADWAVEKLGAKMDFEQLLKEKKKAESAMEIIRPYLEKYAKEIAQSQVRRETP